MTGGRRPALALLLLLLSASGASGSAPRAWVDRTAEAFRQGRLEGVAVAGDGGIVLAPRIVVRGEGFGTRAWGVAVDSRGRVVVATGDPGTVLRYDPATDHLEEIFRATEPEVQAVALSGEVVYAATGPEGRIYRIAPGAAAEAIFDPPDPYIWALIVDGSGRVYAGTGDQGRVYVIDPGGEGRLFYDTAAAHVRALALTFSQDLLAGTAGKAYLYRLPREGGAEVLFAPVESEVTSLIVAPGGEVFAAVVGVPTTGRPLPAERRDSIPAADIVHVTVTADPDPEESTAGEVDRTAAPARRAASSRTLGEGTTVYRLSADGTARVFYSSPSAEILALVALASDLLVAGTAEDGALLRLAADTPETRLGMLQATQVTALAATPAGALLGTSANPGMIFEVAAAVAENGVFLSEIKDAGRLAEWGRLAWDGVVPPRGEIRLSARVGNTAEPDDTWSDWSELPVSGRDGRLRVPPGRYLQYRAALRSGGDRSGPLLREVQVFSLERNEAPRLDSPAWLPPGVIVVSLPNAQPPDQEAVARAEAEAAGRGGTGPRVQTRKTFREGMRTLTWKGEDPNGDPLRFDVDFQPLGVALWRPLAHDLEDEFLAFDTRQLPDGAYRFRVRARDDAGNPGDRALSGEALSRPLDIDNTPPQVEEAKPLPERAPRRIRVVVRDATSPITELRYSLDAGPWTLVLPEDGLPDSISESFEFGLPPLAPGDHLVVIQVRDALGNIGSGKVAFALP